MFQKSKARAELLNFVKKLEFLLDDKPVLGLSEKERSLLSQYKELNDIYQEILKQIDNDYDCCSASQFYGSASGEYSDVHVILFNLDCYIESKREVTSESNSKLIFAKGLKALIEAHQDDPSELKTQVENFCEQHSTPSGRLASIVTDVQLMPSLYEREDVHIHRTGLGNS